jgi:hypothetical protein
MKLSGRRTAAVTNPGKLQALGLDTEGETPELFEGIISQVKKTGGRGGYYNTFLFFILSEAWEIVQDYLDNLRFATKASKFSIDILNEHVVTEDRYNFVMLSDMNL